MKIKLKTKPQSQTNFTSTNSDNNYEQKTIPELVNVLRGTCEFDTYDTIERVLLDREERLTTENSQLQKQLEEEERLRKQAEEEVKKREELCEKGRRVQQSYETLLKDVKRTGLAELKKKNDKLECEVKKLKEKCVKDGNELEDIRRKKAELVEDANELGKLRKKVGYLQNRYSELTKLNEKLVEDNIALIEFRGKAREWEDDKNAVVAGLKLQIGELEESVKNHLATISESREENSKLVDEKLKMEILYKSLCTKYRELQESVAKLDEDTKLLMNFDDSGGRNNEWEPDAVPVVADLFGNDTVEAAPLRRNEDVRGGGNNEREPQAVPMVADLSGNDTVEAAPLRKNEDVRGGGNNERELHGKKTIFGPAVKDADPSSSVATQPKSKFSNAAVEPAKRKYSFPDIETSSDDDSSDDSFFDNLPESCVVSQRKKTKM